MIIGVLAECVKEGRIGGIELSEVQADTIRRAHVVHPIAAVEVEFSLWSTDILRNGVASTCAALGIPIIACSPFGHGFLAGQFKKPENVPEGDIRRHLARFQPGVFEKNRQLVDKLQKLANQKGCSPTQLAISWVRSFSGKEGCPIIIPIPGATTAKRVAESCGNVELTIEDMKTIQALVADTEIVSGRHW